MVTCNIPVSARDLVYSGTAYREITPIHCMTAINGLSCQEEIQTAWVWYGAIVSQCPDIRDNLHPEAEICDCLSTIKFGNTAQVPAGTLPGSSSEPADHAKVRTGSRKRRRSRLDQGQESHALPLEQELLSHLKGYDAA